MSIKGYYLVVIAIIISITFSCRSTTDLEIDDFSSKLVVESFFSEDSVFYLTLAHSRSILDDLPYKIINDAKVMIYEDKSLIDVLNYQEKKLGNRSLYTGSYFRPVQGKNYKLNIEAEGFVTIHSMESSIPPKVLITQFAIDTTKEVKGEVTFKNIATLEFDDPIDIENYYQIKVYSDIEAIITHPKGQLYPNEDTTYTYKSFNPVKIESISPGNYDGDINSYNGIIFADDKFNGETFKIDFLVPDFHLGNPSYQYEKLIYVAELRSISKDMFLYESSRILQENTLGNPLAEPVFVYSNIINGHGIFAGYNSDAETVVFIDK